MCACVCSPHSVISIYSRLAIFSSQCLLMLSKGIMSWLTWSRCGQPTPRPPSPHRQGGSAAPPWATPCRAGLCRATLCWAGLVWPGLDWRHVSPSTAMHLQLAASPFIDFWRSRRRRRSTNPVFGRVALRCVLGYSLDPVACNDDSDDEEGRTTTWVQLLQRLWLLSQILTHLATRFSAPDCNPNTSAPIPTATFHPLRLCMLALLIESRGCREAQSRLFHSYIRPCNVIEIVLEKNYMLNFS